MAFWFGIMRTRNPNTGNLRNERIIVKHGSVAAARNEFNNIAETAVNRPRNKEMFSCLSINFYGPFKNEKNAKKIALKYIRKNKVHSRRVGLGTRLF